MSKLEFVTKSEKAIGKSSSEPVMKVNTRNSHLVFSTALVTALVGEDKDKFRAGIAYKNDTKEAFLFLSEEGLKISSSNIFTSREHTARLAEMFEIPEEKVGIFDVDTTAVVQEGVNTYPIKFKEMQDAKVLSKGKKAEKKAEVKQEETTPETDSQSGEGQDKEPEAGQSVGDLQEITLDTPGEVPGDSNAEGPGAWPGQ